MTTSILKSTQQEILTEISEALSEAQDEAQILRCVVRSASRLGVNGATLFYFENSDMGYPGGIEPVSTWMRPNAEHVSQQADSHPNNPVPVVISLCEMNNEIVYVEDVNTDDRLTPQEKTALSKSSIQAIIYLPLQTTQRYHGLISLFWSLPHTFPETFRELLGLIRPTTLVTVAKRKSELIEQAQQKTNRTIAQINEGLLRSNDEHSILHPFVELRREYHFDSITLCYFENVEQGVAKTIVIVASQYGEETAPPDLETNRFSSEDFPMIQIYQQHSNIIYIEDLDTDNQHNPEIKNRLKQFNVAALIMIPLKTETGHHGLLAMVWDKPTTFSAHLHTILDSVRPTVTAVVALRRGYLLEQAVRNESEHLYRVSEALGSATTFDDIVNSMLNNLGMNPYGTTLLVFENYNFEGATYYIRVATAQGQIEPTGQKVALSTLGNTSFNDTHLMVNEDLAAPDTNPVIAKQLLSYGYRSYISVSATVKGRTLGHISFYFNKVRHFTDHEKRLFNGVGIAVANTLDRIRLREATEAGLRLVQRLYRTTQKLVRAQTLENILNAIASEPSQQPPERIDLVLADGLVTTWYSENAAGTLRNESITDWIRRFVNETELVLSSQNHEYQMPAVVQSLAYFPLSIGNTQLGHLLLTASTPNHAFLQDTEAYRTASEQAAIVVNNQVLYQRLQAALTTTTQRLQTIIQNAPLMLYVLNSKGEITTIEGQALEGTNLKPDQLQKRSILTVYPEETSFNEANHRALSGETFDTTLTLQDKAYQAWYFANKTTDGIEVTALLTDITSLKQIEQERETLIRSLRQTSRYKDEFLATVSHELRTPLNVIIGTVGLILYKKDISDEIKALATRAMSNSDRLLQLINDILDISRLESGRIEIRIEPIDIQNLIKTIVESIQPLADQKHLTVTTHFQNMQFPVINSDLDALTKIFSNLLGNAIKFTDQGTITITVSQTATDLLFRIKDTGIGIAPAKQVIIFESFRQVDQSSTRRHGGSGLGLSIVKSLVLILGGTIDVESALEQGSTFHVSIPLNYYPKTKSVEE